MGPEELKALDGRKVSAMTYESEEYDRPAEKVSGILQTWYVETLDYLQCVVSGAPVDPATIVAEEVSESAVPFLPRSRNRET